MSNVKYVFIFGVSGCGKTTVCEYMSKKFEDFHYIDADWYHTDVNILKMRSGIPLDDSDRFVWLESLSNATKAAKINKRTTIIACSALKKLYREILRKNFSNMCVFIHLNVDRIELERRLLLREDHFFNASLLADQLATIEPVIDELNCYSIDASNTVAENANEILKILQFLTN